MQTHIIESGVVVNTIVATAEEAQAAYHDAICIEATEGGIGWTWDGDMLSPPVMPDLTPEEDVIAIQNKIEQLWSAADKYTASYISGVAIGILTIGTITQKPKALAVTAWSSQVWGAYYTRKAGITATSVLDIDFSGAGPMPYSVPELQAELGL